MKSVFNPSVTLNLFQGPILLKNRSIVVRDNGTVVDPRHASERNARWMLKQVQHDDVVREAAE